MKKTKLFLAIAVAFILCFASALPAFAQTTNEHGAIVAPDESNPVALSITKTLRLPIGTITPSATFNFLAEPVSVDSDTSRAGPALSNLTVSFTPADVDPNAPDANNIMTIVKQTGNLFAGFDFPHAGIFEYEISEIPDTNPDIEDSIHEWLSYSGAKYRLVVYVSNNAAGTGTFVSAVGIFNTANNAGEAIDSTKVEQLAFTNNFVRTNGAVDPEDPDPELPSESTLHVSKTVGGDLGNRQQYFNFSITLNIPDLGQDIPAFYRAYVVENNAVVADITNNVGAGAATGSDAGGAYIQVPSSGATAFLLRHGQRLVFVDTPVGTRYSVTETAVTNYVASFIITTNGVAANAVAGLFTGVQFVGELANSAAFTNTRDSVTPTGLNIDNLPFIGLIALAAGALVIFIVAKSRKKKQLNK